MIMFYSSARVSVQIRRRKIFVKEETMKRIVPLIAASALIICTLPSCSAGGSIVGKWEMEDIDNSEIKVGGLEFKENGKGSMYMDTSSILHADGKKLQVGDASKGFVFDEEYIDYDKNSLKINISGQDMLTLERASGSGSDDNYDGEYTLKSGVLYDTIVNGIKSDAGDGNDTDINVLITFTGDKSEVTFVDIFDYSVNKGKLELSGYASFIGENASGEAVSADYSIKGDTLSITSDKGETETLKRAKK